MSLAKTNKGFVAFLALSGIGALGLAYFLFTSYSRSNEALESYAANRMTLETLEAAKPYPETASLDRVKETAAEFGKKVGELRKTIVDGQAKARQVSDVEFQQELIKSVNETKELAAKNNVKLPDNFGFGMEKYQVGPPSATAASGLLWQLEGIVAVVNELIANGAVSINSIQRVPLAVETEVKDDAAKNRGGAAAEEPILEEQLIELNYTGSQTSVQSVMNYLANSAGPYFYEVRLVRVSNERLLAPERADSFEPVPIEGTGFEDSSSSLPVPAAPTGAPVPETPADPAAAPAEGAPATIPPPPSGPQGPNDLLAQAAPPAPAGAPAVGGDVPPPPPGVPAEGLPSVVPAPAAPALPVAPPKKAMTDARVLMGMENVNVYLQIRIVRFVAPPAAEPESAAPVQ